MSARREVQPYRCQRVQKIASFLFQIPFIFHSLQTKKIASCLIYYLAAMCLLTCIILCMRQNKRTSVHFSPLHGAFSTNISAVEKRCVTLFTRSKTLLAVVGALESPIEKMQFIQFLYSIYQGMPQKIRPNSSPGLHLDRLRGRA